MHARVVAALALCALTAACSGTRTSPYYDRTSPVQIIDQEPGPSHTQVELETNVTVEFSQEIDASEIVLPAVFALTDSAGTIVSATRSYGERVATLDPVARLNPDASYQVALTGLHDIRGRSVADATWTFKTRAFPALPVLIARAPQARNGVPTNFIVRLEFDQPLDGNVASSVSVTDNGTGVGGTATWDPSSRSVVFSPSNPGAIGTNDAIVVTIGTLRDTYGRTLAIIPPLNFQTGNTADVTRPVILGTPSAAETPSGSGVVILHLPPADDGADWLPGELRFEATIARHRLSLPPDPPSNCNDPFDPKTFRAAVLGTSGNFALPPATVATGGNLVISNLTNGVWSIVVTAEDGSGRLSLPTGAIDVTVKQGSVRYDPNVKPLLDTSCALVGCHLGIATPGFVDLSTPALFANKTSTYQSLPEITPFCLDRSYVWRKVQAGFAINGGLMPPPDVDVPQLSRKQRAAIESWIEQGAN